MENLNEFSALRLGILDVTVQSASGLAVSSLSLSGCIQNFFDLQSLPPGLDSRLKLMNYCPAASGPRPLPPGPGRVTVTVVRLKPKIHFAF
jgi:hypothetical protein